MKKLLFCLVVLVTLIFNCAFAKEFTIDDIFFDKENLLIDFGENYDQFEWSCTYGEGTSKRQVARQYITFGHDYLKSKFAATHSNDEYLDLYGFTNFTNSHTDAPYTITVYDNLGNNKKLVLEEAPFDIKIGVNSIFTNNMNITISDNDNVTLKINSYNKVEKVYYYFSDSFEKDVKYSTSVQLYNDIANIPVPRLGNETGKYLYIKVEDEKGNTCCLYTFLAKGEYEKSKAKLFLNTEKPLYNKGSNSFIDLYNPLTGKVETHKTVSDVIIDYASPNSNGAVLLVIAKFNDNKEIISLNYQQLTDSSIYNLNRFNLEDEYSDFSSIGCGYLQDGNTFLYDFYNFDNKYEFTKETKVINSTIKYKKDVVSKIDYKITNKLPKNNWLCCVLCDENNQIKWLICDRFTKANKISKKQFEIEDGELGRFINSVGSDGKLSYKLSNNMYYAKISLKDGIISETDSFDGSLITGQFNTKRPNDLINMSIVMNSKSRYGYDFIINNDGTITIYYTLSSKSYYTKTDIVSKNGTSCIKQSALMDVIGFILNNEKKLKITVFNSIPNDDHIQMLADRIEEAVPNSNRFKTTLNNKAYTNCSIDDEKIVIENKGKIFLTIPRNSTESLNYEVAKKLAKDVGFEVVIGENMADKNIPRSITLKYGKVYKELVVSAEENNGLEEGFIKEADLYDFISYILIYGKNIKIKK